MFVRFRPVRHRLVVDLVETRREDGKVRSEHIARLGSVASPEPCGPRERIVFWRELKERFRNDLAARLANRVSSDDRRKALATIHARIPKPTEADEQAARIETARDDLAFWEKVRDDFSEQGKITKLNRQMIAKVEAQIVDDLAFADKANRQMREAQARFLKLTRGERVQGDSEPSARELAAAHIRKLERRP